MQSPRCRFVPRSFQLDLVVLDQGIREQLVGRLLERCFRLLAVAAFELDVEHLALAHAGDAVHAERLEGTLDRLALRIENAGFERDGDASLHLLSSSMRRTRYGANRSRRKHYRDAIAASLGANRLSAQGPRPAPAGARAPPHGRSRRPVAMPPRTRLACWRQPECPAAARAAPPRRGCASRRRRSAAPALAARRRKPWCRAR